MTTSYRPSWLSQVDADGKPERWRPVLLVALLVANAALVMLVGYMIGAGDRDAAAGIKMGVLMTVPYLVAAALSWSGKGPFGYGLAKGLSVGGIFVWSVTLLLFRGLGNLSSSTNDTKWPFDLFALGLIAFHVAILLLARSAAIRTLQRSSVAWTVVGFVVGWAWFIFSLLP